MTTERRYDEGAADAEMPVVAVMTKGPRYGDGSQGP